LDFGIDERKLIKFIDLSWRYSNHPQIFEERDVKRRFGPKIERAACRHSEKTLLGIPTSHEQNQIQTAQSR